RASSAILERLRIRKGHAHRAHLRRNGWYTRRRLAITAVVTGYRWCAMACIRFAWRSEALHCGQRLVCRLDAWRLRLLWSCGSSCMDLASRAAFRHGDANPRVSDVVGDWHGARAQRW